MKASMILFGALAWNMMTCGIAAKRPQNSKGLLDQPNNEGRQSNEKASEITKDTKGIKKIRSDIAGLFQHNNIGILLIAEFNAFYVFASWAIFLVSLGKTLGLSDQEAAFLSAAGGLGGFTGRTIAFTLFKINRVNALTSTLIPCFITGTVFVVVTMSTSFTLILILIFISGITQGLNSSCVIAQMTGMVCPYHYRLVIVFEGLACGFGTQFSGFVSGTMSHRCPFFSHYEYDFDIRD